MKKNKKIVVVLASLILVCLTLIPPVWAAISASDNGTAEPMTFPKHYKTTGNYKQNCTLNFLVIENTGDTINGVTTAGADNSWIEIWEPDGQTYIELTNTTHGHTISPTTVDIWAKIAEDDNTTWHNCGQWFVGPPTADVNITDDDWSYDFGNGEHMWIMLTFAFADPTTYDDGIYATDDGENPIRWLVRGWT